MGKAQKLYMSTLNILKADPERFLAILKKNGIRGTAFGYCFEEVHYERLITAAGVEIVKEVIRTPDADGNNVLNILKAPQIKVLNIASPIEMGEAMVTPNPNDGNNPVHGASAIRIAYFSEINNPKLVDALVMKNHAGKTPIDLMGFHQKCIAFEAIYKNVSPPTSKIFEQLQHNYTLDRNVNLH